MSEKVHKFESQCADNLKVLEAANSAAIKMTTHKVSNFLILQAIKNKLPAKLILFKKKQ